MIRLRICFGRVRRRRERRVAVVGMYVVATRGKDEHSPQDELLLSIYPLNLFQAFALLFDWVKTLVSRDGVFVEDRSAAYLSLYSFALVGQRQWCDRSHA